MAFNLYSYQRNNRTYRIANQLPNGQTTIDLNNGQGPGMGDGVQLTDGSGNSNMADGMSSKKELKEIIGDILYEMSIGNDPEKIKAAASQAMNAEIPQEFAGNDDLAKMVAALGRRAGEDPSKASTNPQTGEKEQSLEELAEAIAQAAGWKTEELLNEARHRTTGESNGWVTPSPGGTGGVPPVRTSKKNTPVTTTRDEDFKETEKADPAKKRKKGNPFKVLMGLVGKMLDHGMGRREIVKKVMRQEGNKWKPETVEKCIKVVMDARKKEQREKMLGEAQSMKFNLQRYAGVYENTPDYDIMEDLSDEYCYDCIQKLIPLLHSGTGLVEAVKQLAKEGVLCQHCRQWADENAQKEQAIQTGEDPFASEEQKYGPMGVDWAIDKASENRWYGASEKFNLRRYAQHKPSQTPEKQKQDEFKGRKSLYDIPRDIKLMSTMELISRLAYLQGASNFDGGMNENNPGGAMVEGKQFNKDLNQVKGELARRNYTDEYIGVITKAVQGIPSE